MLIPEKNATEAAAPPLPPISLRAAYGGQRLPDLNAAGTKRSTCKHYTNQSLYGFR